MKKEREKRAAKVKGEKHKGVFKIILPTKPKTAQFTLKTTYQEIILRARLTTKPTVSSTRTADKKSRQ